MMLKYGNKGGVKIGSVVDAVTGVFDTVTGDMLDLDGSKKQQKKMEKRLKEQEREAKAKEEKEKEKQKKSEMDFYESLRQGNLGLLKPKETQTIG